MHSNKVTPLIESCSNESLPNLISKYPVSNPSSRRNSIMQIPPSLPDRTPVYANNPIYYAPPVKEFFFRDLSDQESVPTTVHNLNTYVMTKTANNEQSLESITSIPNSTPVQQVQAPPSSSVFIPNVKSTNTMSSTKSPNSKLSSNPNSRRNSMLQIQPQEKLARSNSLYYVAPSREISFHNLAEQESLASSFKTSTKKLFDNDSIVTPQSITGEEKRPTSVELRPHFYICSFRCLLITMMLVMLVIPVLSLIGISIGFSILASNDVKNQVMAQSYFRAESYVSDFLWICMEATRQQRHAIYRSYFMNEGGLNTNSSTSNFYSYENYVNILRLLAVSHHQYIGKIFLVDFTCPNTDYLYVDESYELVLPVSNEDEGQFDNMQRVFLMKQANDETFQSFYYFSKYGKLRTVTDSELMDKWDPTQGEFYKLALKHKEALVPMDVQWQGSSIEERIYTCYQSNVYSPYDSTFLGMTSINVNIKYLSDFVRSFYVSPNSFVAIVEFFTRESNSGAPVLHKRVLGFKNSSAIAVFDESSTFDIRIAEAHEVSDPLLKHVLLNILPSDYSGYKNKSTAEYNPHLNSFSFSGEDYVVAHGVVKRTVDLNMHWIVVVVAPDGDFVSNVMLMLGLTIGIAFVCLAFGVLFSCIFSQAVSKPLRFFSRESKALSNLEAPKTSKVYNTTTEIHELSIAFDKMKTTVRSFKKFVPNELLRDMLKNGNEITLGGRLVGNLTIFFSDIENFTTISEELDPEMLIQHVSEYFHVLTEEIIYENGTLDKYIGDSVMAFWGAPDTSAISGLRGCRAALRCQQRMSDLRRKWQREAKPLFRCRIGLHSGSCVVGNIGSIWRLNFTIIGDSVNLASRLEGTNKFYGTSILLSEDTFLQPYVAEQLEVRKIDQISVKGKSVGCVIYELLGRRTNNSIKEPSKDTKSSRPLPTPNDEIMRLRQIYERALEMYASGDFAQALLFFEECLKIRPEDGPSRTLRERCREYAVHPPRDWNGIYHNTEK
ncbi:predicted protein [Naegleria gruberi]|uniref:Predicted protein n=1 Tax=Naegleria gruberi TaxID=5762 RepID=D2VUI4_NAEGR|nr:uncharacterized protein NAEGRDRAFT_72673 [Naegleria gruberi]EFC39517.1 predicted protein [Naegleria gruberi]|eukprot:XP_002672261.1 predicted protein [Naegleria gruberi strain NEG-M]